MAELPLAWQDVIEAVRSGNAASSAQQARPEQQQQQQEGAKAASLAQLREKATALMTALRAHDSDTWPGKPSQTDLGVRFAWQPSTTTTTTTRTMTNVKDNNADEGDARASLDALMSEYMDGVVQLRAHEEGNNNSSGSSAAAAAALRNDADVAALLQQLDTLPALPYTQLDVAADAATLSSSFSLRAHDHGNSRSSTVRKRTRSPTAASKRMTQTFLDFGQSDMFFGRTCARCGMLYTDLDEDVAVHARYCRRHGRDKQSSAGDNDDDDVTFVRSAAAVRALAALQRRCGGGGGDDVHATTTTTTRRARRVVMCDKLTSLLCSAHTPTATTTAMLLDDVDNTAAAAACAVYVLSCSPPTALMQEADDDGTARNATRRSLLLLRRLLCGFALCEAYCSHAATTTTTIARTNNSTNSSSGSECCYSASPPLLAVAVDEDAECVLCALVARAHARTHALQHVTHADVDGVWLRPSCSAAGEGAVTSPHSCTLHAYFAPRQAAHDAKDEGKRDTSTTSAHTTRVGAALCACVRVLARRLVYGAALHPRSSFSYADGVLRTLRAWRAVNTTATTSALTRRAAQDSNNSDDDNDGAARAMLLRWLGEGDSTLPIHTHR